VSSDPVSAYLERRGVVGPWNLDLPHETPLRGGIVIPSLAEHASIPGLLQSLCADHTLPASGLAIVFVVNNREDASPDEKEDNRRTLETLRQVRHRLPFPLGIIDATSPGLSLPNRDGGVGLARKLGHDLLLPRLDFDSYDPVIVSLDCDTLVEPGYAGAILAHFRAASTGGAVIPFAHQSAATEREVGAIVRYELFLRCYVAGLAFAGSPYGFHTVGSAMACRASAYLKCGGMNRKRAGEDFYFLQSLAKTAGVQQVAGAMVRPSPRRSDRVPFGTGRAMGALLDGEQGAVLFYPRECYILLRRWIELATAACRGGWADLAGKAGELSPHLSAFLSAQGFPAVWEGFLRHHRGAERRLKAFHDWFDAFRIMKLFHFLAAGPNPRRPAEEAVNTWSEVWGGDDLTMTERLAYLRRLQGASVIPGDCS